MDFIKIPGPVPPHLQPEPGLRPVLYVDTDDPWSVDAYAVEMWTHGQRVTRLTPLEITLACWLQSTDRCCVPDAAPGSRITILR